MKTIAYIIGCRGFEHIDRRFENLYLTLVMLIKIKRLLEQCDITLNIIIVEQDATPKFSMPDDIRKHINYLFVYNSGYYNRGWAFNVGYKEFDADYYFFADGDILMNIDEMIDVFKTCFKYDAVNPYANIYDSTEEHVTSSTFNPLIIDEDFETKFSKRENTCFSGGIMGINKYSMNVLKGWDERFRGRGWEDYAFTAKCELFLYSMYTYPYSALHLWHPYEINTTREINQELNSQYEQYDFKDFVRQIEHTNIFGSPTKYSTLLTCTKLFIKKRLSNCRYNFGKKYYKMLLKRFCNKKHVFLYLCGQYHQSCNKHVVESGFKPCH